MVPNFVDFLLNDCKLILCKKIIPSLVPVRYDPSRKRILVQISGTISFDHFAWAYAPVKLIQITTAGTSNIKQYLHNVYKSNIFFSDSYRQNMFIYLHTCFLITELASVVATVICRQRRWLNGVQLGQLLCDAIYPLHLGKDRLLRTKNWLNLNWSISSI